jgi:predicted DNA-binding transcriptional regulator YafY
MPDRLERLTNLVAVLLDTRRPITLEEIVERVPGYPEAPKEAYRRQFERDKDTLRGIGVPVSLEKVHPLDQAMGYRIRPEDYYLPSLDLTPDERVALHLAVTALRLEGGQGHQALLKLGGLEGTAAAPIGALPSVPALPALFEAYRRRARVSFRYRGDLRRLDPYGILFRDGHWYAVGFDPDRGENRSFRADRIEGTVEPGPGGSFERPGGFDSAAALRDEPWRFGDEEPVEALVLIGSSQASWVAADLGPEAVAERRDDGSVLVRLLVTNRAALRSFVLDLLDAAEVLGPPELRADMAAWLEALASEQVSG